jgi:hypothetical protein
MPIPDSILNREAFNQDIVAGIVSWPIFNHKSALKFFELHDNRELVDLHTRRHRARRLQRLIVDTLFVGY